MKKLLVLPLALLLLANSADADLITLGSSNPVGSPLAMLSGSTSGAFRITIVNNVNPDPAADFMNAWQFSLTIVADVGATGTLTFNSPTSQTFTPPNGEPTNYIFAGNNFGISVTNSGSTLSANDIALLAAVEVPTAPGANLLGMDFLASADASGLFGIFAQRGSANTSWTDNAAIPTTRFFANVPDGSGLVRIGEVSVSAAAVVPEPGSLTLFVVGCIGILGYRRFRGASSELCQAAIKERSRTSSSPLD